MMDESPTRQEASRPGSTWYAASCLEPPLGTAPLEDRATAEIGIVGGGLAGLTLALGLAERGAAPVVLEAGEVGAGASGRNGGLLSAGFTRGFASLCRSLGVEAATRLFQLSVDAVGLVEQRIAEGAIACRPQYGVLEASWFDQACELQAAIALENDLFARDLRFWPREQLRQLYRSKRYFDGIFDPKARHLDPLALTRGHARLALAAGARLFERSPVTGIARQGSGWRVTTRGGQLDVDRLVLATSAYGRGLHPALGRGLLPIHTYIIVSEPLAGAERDSIRAPYAVFDDRFATGYYRLVGAGRKAGPRLLWGGQIGLAEAPDGLAGRLLADLALVYPDLGRIRVAHAWSGRMGFARHRMPVIRELEPGLWITTGFAGHGLNTTTMAGEMLAAALLDRAGPAGDDWRLLAPFALAWTGGPLGPLAAQALYRSRAAQDRVRAAWHQLRQRSP
jgi:gamma-glutamylputrescine oxidase